MRQIERLIASTCTKDILARLGICSGTTTSLKKIWKSHDIAIDTKVQLLKVLVWPVHPSGPIMGSLESPYRISYWSSTETVALNCFILKKPRFYVCISGNRQTNKQTDRQSEGHHRRITPRLHFMWRGLNDGQVCSQ